jgi:hypothetical protein
LSVWYIHPLRRKWFINGHLPLFLLIVLGNSR